ARASSSQVYPPRALTTSTEPASSFVELNRAPGRQLEAEPTNGKPAGMILLDPGRFAGAEVLVQAELFTGIFQPLGAVATVVQPPAGYTHLQVPDPWPAFSYAPSFAALAGDLPDTGLLSILIKPLAGDFIPA